MKIKRATLNLIYSFLPVAGDMTYDANVFKSLHQSKKESCLSGKGKLDTGQAVDNLYNPDDLAFFKRTGLSSYLTLNLNIAYETEEIIKIEDYSDKYDIKIIPFFRYFSFGSSLTFHVIIEPKLIDESLSTSDVYDLLKIISTEQNNSSQVLLFDNENYKTIFELFKFLVTQKLIRANKKYFQLLFDDSENPVSENFNNSKQMLFSFLESNHYFIDYIHKKSHIESFEHIKSKLLLEEQNEFNTSELTKFIIDNCITLLCLKEKQITLNDNKESNIPWLITNLELDNSRELEILNSLYETDSRKEAILNKQKEIRRIENELAPLLYRAVDPNLDGYKLEPSYDSFNSINKIKGLNNMYLDARFYLHMSRRSILTICHNRNEFPATYVTPTLLEICESAHTRWQGLIILNFILDSNIRTFANHKADRLKPSEKLKIIINLFKKTLSCLENPSSYVISGDSLREINEMLSDTYNLKHLEDSALKKLNVLEKVFDLGINLSAI